VESQGDFVEHPFSKMMKKGQSNRGEVVAAQAVL
jgi:hypothetical protein